MVSVLVQGRKKLQCFREKMWWRCLRGIEKKVCEIFWPSDLVALERCQAGLPGGGGLPHDNSCCWWPALSPLVGGLPRDSTCWCPASWLVLAAPLLWLKNHFQLSCFLAFLSLFLWFSVCLFACLPACLLVCLRMSTSLPICLPNCPLAYMPACLPSTQAGTPTPQGQRD